jgi:cytochrome c-type biogenesis protein
MIADVSIFMAFTAGIISFLSPCVLPLIPGYISFISGTSLRDSGTEDINTLYAKGINPVVILNSLFFIAGFSIVFVLLGASATWVGAFIASRISIITKIAGLIILFFGLFKMGLFQFLFFYKEVTFQVTNRKYGLAGALIIGAAFALGWTPCIGPILGAILVYASTLEHIHQGILLLLFYSLGMGLPFLLAAVGINYFLIMFKRIKHHLGLIEKISGFIMVILGILIFTNKLFVIAGYLNFLNVFAL